MFKKRHGIVANNRYEDAEPDETLAHPDASQTSFQWDR